MRPIWDWLAKGSLIVIVGSVLLFTYWQYQPSIVLTAKQPFKVSAVDGRTLVVIDATYCKKIKLSGTIRMSFVSKSAEIFAPMTTENQPKACYENQRIPILIPNDLPPDTYYVKFSAMYKINPIKNFSIILVSDQFQIK